jgi:signal transduction histidine kinase
MGNKSMPIEHGDADANEQGLLRDLATLGELALPLAHAFNNFLNNLVLKVAVLDQQASDAWRPMLAQIRQQAAAMAEYVKKFQQYQHEREPLGQTDLNQVIRERVELLEKGTGKAGTAPCVLLELAEDLPPVAGTWSEIARCGDFLLRNALNAAPSQTIAVRTARSREGVRLEVEDAGPGVDPADAAKLFELTGTVRPGTHPLELAACRSIVRLLKGRLHAESPSGGGLRVIVELPAAP